MQAWWVMPRRKGPQGRAETPAAERRRRRRYPRATMTRCCLDIFGRPSVKQLPGRGRCLLPDDQCTKIGRLVAEVLREKHPDMQAPPVEKPACAAFKEYKEVPETVPLDFTEDEIMWVASNISGAAGALGLEAIELRNWLLHFGCVS